MSTNNCFKIILLSAFKIYDVILKFVLTDIENIFKPKKRFDYGFKLYTMNFEV